MTFLWWGKGSSFIQRDSRHTSKIDFRGVFLQKCFCLQAGEQSDTMFDFVNFSEASSDEGNIYS